MTVLRGCETRMVSQYSDARTNFQASKRGVVRDIKHTVFLRQRFDAHIQIISG
jgi:hypothetical protein